MLGVWFLLVRYKLCLYLYIENKVERMKDIFLVKMLSKVIKMYFIFYIERIYFEKKVIIGF